MLRRYLTLLIALLALTQTRASEKPKLVVVLVVDQIRSDYLTQQQALLSGGFKRLLDRGFQFTETYHEHADKLLIHREGHIYFDLWQANELTLKNAGVRSIEISGLCTACHPEDWFSHRAEKGKTGRFGALIGLK